MKKKIKVALMTYAIDGRPAKGTAIVARKCVEALLKRQDQFDLTLFHYEKSNDPIYQCGAKEVIFPTVRPSFLNRRSIRQRWYLLRMRENFDVVQWFQPRLYPFFWRFPASKIIVEVHGAGDVAKEAPFDLGRIMFNSVVKLFKYKIAAAIVASDFAKEDIVRGYGFKRDQVKVIHNGADAIFKPVSREEMQRVRAKYSLPDDFFLGVGRLNPNKNTFSTLQAFELFCKKVPEASISFVNVGAKGSDRQKIFSWLESAPVKDRVSFLEYVDEADLPALYCLSRALIFPLLNEGFGLPVIEAMACGVPTVAARTASPDITEKEAILVDAYSIESISEGMVRVYKDEALAKEMVSAGLIKSKSFTWERMGERLSSLIESLVIS
jgi:glycosyltransferase involved in cell wall biosynthesis